MFSPWTRQIVDAQRSSTVPTLSVSARPDPLVVAEVGECAPVLADTLSAPNDGAHRLSWWIAANEALRRHVLFFAGATGGTLERMIAGDVTPSAELAVAIARATEGDVLPEDWDVAPGPAWTTRPALRAEGE